MQIFVTKQMALKSKVKVSVLNLSNKVKILDLLKGSTSLAEVGQHYRKNESSICKCSRKKEHEIRRSFW
jgi:hypothetical protein